MLHENSDLLMKFRKEDEKNALLTEQNERQVLFCTVTSSSRKLLRTKVTPDLYLTYSKNGGNLGLVLKMKNIA